MGKMYKVDSGDPINDQMLAQAKEDIRYVLDKTVHHLIDQMEAVDAPLSSVMAALVTDYIRAEEYMPRERLASLLALALFMIAKEEREVVADGKTERRS